MGLTYSHKVPSQTQALGAFEVSVRSDATTHQIGVRKNGGSAGTLTVECIPNGASSYEPLVVNGNQLSFSFADANIATVMFGGSYERFRFTPDSFNGTSFDTHLSGWPGGAASSASSGSGGSDATAANQVAGNTTLLAIDSKLAFTAPGGSTVTDVSVTTANVDFTLRAAGGFLRGGLIFNDTNGMLLILEAPGTASLTHKSYLLYPGDLKTLPEGCYTGIYKALCTGTGTVNLTEYA